MRRKTKHHMMAFTWRGAELNSSNGLTHHYLASNANEPSLQWIFQAIPAAPDPAWNKDQLFPISPAQIEDFVSQTMIIVCNHKV